MGGGGRGHPKKTIREKGGGHVKYFSKTLKQHNVLILKDYYRTNIVDRIQIYHKFSFCFEITLDVAFLPLPLSLTWLSAVFIFPSLFVDVLFVYALEYAVITSLHKLQE